jgi:23S rRNA pseudouridine2605 synthase
MRQRARMSLKRNPSPPRRHRANEQLPRHGLARVMSKLGVCSRTQAIEFVRAGRVRVDGRIVRNPETPVDASNATVTLDGAPIRELEKVYIALNKPRGYVTTAKDERDRSTVYDLLREKGFPADRWIAPVGRLDKASEGLLLLTNDTTWSARLADPASHVEKTYHVQIDAVPDAALLSRLRDGVDVDGETMRFKSVSELRRGDKNAWFDIVLDEGRNRQIRRVLAACDINVLRLIRVAIGPLPLGTLAKGAWRELTRAEIEQLGVSKI